MAGESCCVWKRPFKLQEENSIAFWKANITMDFLTMRNKIKFWFGCISYLYAVNKTRNMHSMFSPRKLKIGISLFVHEFFTSLTHVFCMHSRNFSTHMLSNFLKRKRQKHTHLQWMAEFLDYWGVHARPGWVSAGTLGCMREYGRQKSLMMGSDKNLWREFFVGSYVHKLNVFSPCL